MIEGYTRGTGYAGARNYVAVVPTVGCVNEIARRIAESVENARPMLHHQGCCQLPPDVRTVTDVLTGVCRNPNVAAVVLVSLGCESVDAEDIVQAVAPDKPWSWCASRRWAASRRPLTRELRRPRCWPAICPANEYNSP